MSTKHVVEFMQLDLDVEFPKKGTDLSAGFDLIANEDVVIPQLGTATIPLGFATSIPDNLHCRIESRSGMALKGAVVLTGVIDADYRGEWKVILGNFTGEELRITKDQRIAQAVFRETPRVVFQAVSSLSATGRGAGGFGSTGQ